MSNALWIQNGRVVDPAQNLDQIADVLIVDGKIAALGADAASQAPQNAEKIDATGKIVAPGLIDMHVHLREPGGEDAETVATGALAALSGGFTSIACPPNTNPPIDSPSTVALIRELAERARL